MKDTRRLFLRKGRDSYPWFNPGAHTFLEELPGFFFDLPLCLNMISMNWSPSPTAQRIPSMLQAALAVQGLHTEHQLNFCLSASWRVLFPCQERSP